MIQALLHPSCNFQDESHFSAIEYYVTETVWPFEGRGYVQVYF